MGKYFEELSKDLARGVSRREALWRFAAGIAAAVGALLTGRSVKAQGRGNDVCVEFCRAQGLSGREFGECVAWSAHCPRGHCAMMISGTSICVPVGDDGACVEFCRAQELTEDEFVECLVQSAQCSNGYCAMLVNDKFVCVPAD